MKINICPECKEVIPDGCLCGSNPNCKACSARINTDDLIAYDTENIINHTANSSNIDNPSSSPFNNAEINQNAYTFNAPQNTDNPLDALKTKKNHDLSALSSYKDSDTVLNRMRNMMSNLIPTNPVIQNPTSKVLSIDEIPLPPKITIENSFNAKTFVYSPKVADMIFFSVIWNSFIFIFFFFFLRTLISDPASVTVNGHPGSENDVWLFLLFMLPFIAVGIGTAYLAINQFFKKTWIEVNQNSLMIESGISRKHQYKNFPRNPQSTTVICDVGYRSNNSPRYYIAIESGSEKVKITSGLTHHEAKAMERFFISILNAEL